MLHVTARCLCDIRRSNIVAQSLDSGTFTVETCRCFHLYDHVLMVLAFSFCPIGQHQRRRRQRSDHRSSPLTFSHHPALQLTIVNGCYSLTLVRHVTGATESLCLMLTSGKIATVSCSLFFTSLLMLVCWFVAYSTHTFTSKCVPLTLGLLNSAELFLAPAYFYFISRSGGHVY